MSLALHLATSGYELGVGRTVPTAAAVVGLVGAVAGGWALARPVRRAVAVAAVVAGAVGVVVGWLHAADAAGGPGTGNGLVGAVVALVVGALGVLLGGAALVRSRRRGTVHR